MAGCDSGYDMHHSRYLNGTVYDTIALPNATGDPDHLLSKCCAKCTADGKKCDGWQFGEICDDPNPPSGTEITLFPCAVSSDSRSFAKTGSGQRTNTRKALERNIPPAIFAGPAFCSPKLHQLCPGVNGKQPTKCPDCGERL